MKRIRFKNVKRNEWQQPIMKGYQMVCCDCGLVHTMEFRVVGVRTKRVQFRCDRAQKLTVAFRKQEGIVMR